MRCVYSMNINDFVSELNNRCRANGVMLSKKQLKIVIEEMIKLLKYSCFNDNIVNIKNFGTFYTSKTIQRKLPNGRKVNTRDVLRFRPSVNFKNNR